jgi:hypothetical protein
VSGSAAGEDEGWAEAKAKAAEKAAKARRSFGHSFIF